MKNFNTTMARFGLNGTKVTALGVVPFGSAAEYLAQLEAKYEIDAAVPAEKEDEEVEHGDK